MLQITRINGETSSFEDELQPFGFAMDDTISSVEVMAGIESIPDGCFCNCHNLTSVTLAPDVRTLEGNVFKGCESLKSVSIGCESLAFSSSDFEGCLSLDASSLPPVLSEKLAKLSAEAKQKEEEKQQQREAHQKEMERKREEEALLKAKKEEEERARREAERAKWEEEMRQKREYEESHKLTVLDWIMASEISISTRRERKTVHFCQRKTILEAIGQDGRNRMHEFLRSRQKATDAVDGLFTFTDIKDAFSSLNEIDEIIHPTKEGIHETLMDRAISKYEETGEWTTGLDKTVDAMDEANRSEYLAEESDSYEFMSEENLFVEAWQQTESCLALNVILAEIISHLLGIMLPEEQQDIKLKVKWVTPDGHMILDVSDYYYTPGKSLREMYDYIAWGKSDQLKVTNPEPQSTKEPTVKKKAWWKRLLFIIFAIYLFYIIFLKLHLILGWIMG